MLRIQSRMAALMGLATLASAADTSINCGPNNGHNTDYNTVFPSDFTVYSSKTADWDIRCHSFLRMPVYDWDHTGKYISLEACIDICAANPQCNAALTYNGQCVTSNNARLAEGNLERDWPYPLAIKRSGPLNCKDKSSNGKTFTPPGSTTQYQIMCDYQFGGNTLGPSKKADTLEQCISYCDMNPSCVDVVYSDAKYCWFKSTKTNGYVSPGWYTAVKVGSSPAPPPSVGAVNCFDNSADGKTITLIGSDTAYDIRCNFQYDGDNLGTAELTETFDACVSLCDDTQGCVESIWSDAKYCFLKSSKKTEGYQSAGWFSAVKHVAAN